MTDLLYRVATEADVPTIVALVTSAYRGESSRAGWTSEADLLEGQRIAPEVLAEDIRRPESVVLLVERPTVGEPGAPAALVGCAHLARVAPETAYFGMFAVDPSIQGGGIGKQVMAEVEHRVGLLWDVREIEMTVIEQRGDLIEFYERRGFARTGEFRDFPYGDERFGTPLRDDLRMVVLAKPLS